MLTSLVGAFPLSPDTVRYELMATIGVDGTVGSLAVGYTATPGSPDDGWAKLFVPVYEKDRIYVFKCGAGALPRTDRDRPPRPPPPTAPPP